MTLAINQTKLTTKQFLMLGEDPPGVRLELVHGEIAVSPSPSFPHAHAVMQLSGLLLSHINQHDLGAVVADVDTIFGEFNVRRPDVIFIAKSRLHLLHGHGIPFSPDLCVEIISPSSARIDREDKFSLYAEYAVPNYWIVDPVSRTFDAYRCDNGRYVLSAHACGDETVSAGPFADLQLPLAQLWAPIGTP